MVVRIRITAADAARDFPALLARVQEAGATFVVEQNGEAICRIEPVASKTVTVGDLAAFLDRESSTDDEFARDLEWVQKSQLPV